MREHELRLWCNEAPVRPDLPIRVCPGRGNRLAVDWDLAVEAAVVRVETVTPDGRTRSVTTAFADGRAEAELGPLCVPAQYDYEAGIVFRRGYRCRITVERPGDAAIFARYSLATVCSRDQDAEWLMLGAPGRCVYNDGYIPEGGIWNPFGESAGAMQPALQLRLAPGVLLDRDRVEICYRSRPEPAVAPIEVRLRIRDEGDKDMVSPIDLQADTDWRQWRPDVGSWPTGTYTVELLPQLDGRFWDDGPRLQYRREPADAGRVRVSPYAPFSFRRDESRAEKEIRSWPAALPEGWETGVCGNDTALFCNGDPDTTPVRIDPDLKGTYAVFVRPVNTIHVRVGESDIVRRVHEPEGQDFGDMFAHVADLTGQKIDLHSNDLQRLLEALGDTEAPEPAILDLYEKDGTRSAPFSRDANRGEIRSGVRRIRLVPVTEASARDFREATLNPPFELRGVDDWWCHFLQGHRVDAEQLDTILRGQREVGIKALNWSVGRSSVQYPSRLPDAEPFPCAPIPPTEDIGKRHHWIAWKSILESCDALGYPLERRQEHDMRMHGWLAMNRHYGAETLHGLLTSPWARSHPEYYQYRKCMKSVDYTRMEYYFPEVRKERLDILEEVASYGPDGLVIGCCRQPPMVSYNPKMVAAYKAETGIDPTGIDIEDGKPYLDWIQWRAGFFTDLLRELADRLRVVEERTGHRVPVIARIPGVGLEWNLAQGLDVRTWIAERLVDELQLDPLECASGRASHDVRPYLALCRAHGIPVFGGVNGTTGANLGYGSMEDYTPVVGLRRAIGLLRAGVNGIEIYEAELFARCCERRWLIPLWGDPERAERWLAESNLEAVFPVTARNAALGHDNHWFGGETLHGAHDLPRGAKRAL